MASIFTRIIQREIPATILHEDEWCIAFMDINPVNPGHILVVSKEEKSSLTELNHATVSRMFEVAKRLHLALKKSGLRCEGLNYVINDGAAAGQEVFHCHLHLIPRFAGDGFGFRRSASYGATSTGREQLAAAAEEIKKYFVGESEA